jgi:hypothetical protein
MQLACQAIKKDKKPALRRALALLRKPQTVKCTELVRMHQVQNRKHRHEAASPKLDGHIKLMLSERARIGMKSSKLK